MFSSKRNRLETLYYPLGGIAISPPGMRTGDMMPPIGYCYNAYNTGLEDISDTAFGEKDVQSVGVTWAITATNVGVEDIRYKLKQIIFGWRNHVFVIEESAIIPDDSDVIFFDMPELNIFGDESPSEGDEIYMFLCTGSGVTVVPPSISGLYSSL